MPQASRRARSLHRVSHHARTKRLPLADPRARSTRGSGAFVEGRARFVVSGHRGSRGPRRLFLLRTRSGSAAERPGQCRAHRARAEPLRPRSGAGVAPERPGGRRSGERAAATRDIAVFHRVAREAAPVERHREPGQCSAGRRPAQPTHVHLRRSLDHEHLVRWRGQPPPRARRGAAGRHPGPEGRSRVSGDRRAISGSAVRTRCLQRRPDPMRRLPRGRRARGGHHVYPRLRVPRPPAPAARTRRHRCAGDRARGL